MTWHLSSSEPITTESFRAVHTHDGGRPAIAGGVYDTAPGTTWDDGSPVQGRCLDLYPTIR
jgi:hypothetical protein